MKQGHIISLNEEFKGRYIKAYFLNTEGVSSVDSDPYLKKIYGYLPKFRKEKVDKLKNESSRIQSVAAFGLLGHALREMSLASDCSLFERPFYPSCELDWEELGYDINEYGKPFFSNKSDIFFSISHTNGMVMCAVADGEIGCDVEIINRYKVDYDPHEYAEERFRLAKRFFSEDECAFLDESETDLELTKRFTRVWTAKESYIKYIGLGLSKPLNAFDLFTCNPTPMVIFEDDKYCGSICLDLK